MDVGRIVALVLGLVIGAVLALVVYRPGAKQTESEVRSLQTDVRDWRRDAERLGREAAERETYIATLSREKRELRKRIEALEARDDDALPISREFLRKSSARLWSALGRTNTTFPPTINPTVIRSLRLTGKEAEAVNGALRAAMDELMDLEEPLVTARKQEEQRIELEVAAFAEQGGRVRDQLMASVRGVLGERRLDDWYLLQGKSYFEKAYLEFGKRRLVLRLERVPGGYYKGSEELTYGQHGRRTASLVGGPDLLLRYARYAKWFPESWRKTLPEAAPRGDGAGAGDQAF